jgi:hypothetical protein
MRPWWQTTQAMAQPFPAAGGIFGFIPLPRPVLPLVIDMTAAHRAAAEGTTRFLDTAGRARQSATA